VSFVVVQTGLDTFAKLMGQTGEEWIYVFHVSILLWLNKERVSATFLVNNYWGEQKWKG